MEDFKQIFEAYVTDLANVGNTTLIPRSQYDDIQKYLVAKKKGEKPKSLNEKLRKKIIRNKIQLMDYPLLNINDMLCVPSKDDKVPYFLFVCIKSSN